MIPDRRHRVLAGVDRVAAWTGVHATLHRRLRSSILMLMYHKVLRSDDAATYPMGNLVVHETTFASQVRWLAARYRVVTAAEAMTCLARAPIQDGPLICLTFDDGYADNHAVVAPILQEHGLHGTFFVTTDFVSGTPQWYDCAASAFARLEPETIRALAGEAVPLSGASDFVGWLKGVRKERRHELVAMLRSAAGDPPQDSVFAAMRPAHLSELVADGHEVGAHSVTHPILTQLKPSELAYELCESRKQIEAWTGVAPVGFCYPNGDHNATVRDAVRAAGYTYACGTSAGANDRRCDPFALRRRTIAQTSSTRCDGAHSDAAFAAEVLGLHDILRGARTRLRRLRGHR